MTAGAMMTGPALADHSPWYVLNWHEAKCIVSPMTPVEYFLFGSAHGWTSLTVTYPSKNQIDIVGRTPNAPAMLNFFVSEAACDKFVADNSIIPLPTTPSGFPPYGTADFAQNTVPFPDYGDPNAYCHQANWKIDGPAEAARLEREASADWCIVTEQEGYDTARALWPRLTQANAQLCVDQTRAKGNLLIKYSNLGLCAASRFDTQPKPPHVFVK
jgi:hypothetical protein